MANSQLGQKDRPWRARITLQSGEASSSFAVGNAVVLLSSNTAKGVLPATAGATLSAALTAGIATRAAAPGEFFDVIVGGYAPSVMVGLLTRAASGNTWPSFQAIAAGDYFIVDTTNNGFVRVGSAVSSNPFGYQIIALSSVAGATTTQASTVGGTALSSTVTVAAWVRTLL